MTSAPPSRTASDMLAVLRKAFEAGEDIRLRFADALGDRDLALTALRSELPRIRGTTSTWCSRGCWFTLARVPIRGSRS